MRGQGFDKVDDSEKLSAFEGACYNLGARREGALVFFRVLAPLADEVFLVGSFNGWADDLRLTKNQAGIWQASISRDEISDGDRYKFKARVGEEIIYLSDPYAVENDGEPYFNSVYREGDHHEEFCSGRPLNIYEIEEDGWYCYDGCREVDYATLSRELLPYLLQMGYTHVCVSGACNQAQGGEVAFKKLVDTMHSASVGVLVRTDTDGLIGLKADGTVTRVEDAESSGGPRHRIELEGQAQIFIRDSGEYQKHYRQASADKRPRRDAAAIAYLLLKEGRMLTRMGCEAGQESRLECFDRRAFEPIANARFQLFCSRLGNAYLSNPEIWEGSALSESESYGIKVMRRIAHDFEMILATDLFGGGGYVRIPAEGEWRVLLDSSSLLGYEKAAVSLDPNKAIGIMLPSYGAVLLERIK